MKAFLLLRLLWRKIRRSRKIYNVASKHNLELRNAQIMPPIASTYLSFNRPHPPSLREKCFQQGNSMLDRCYLYNSTSSTEASEYWEIDDTAASGNHDSDNIEAQGSTFIVKRVISSDQFEYPDSCKNGSTIIRLINVLKSSIRSSRKGHGRASLFIPVCSSTPLCPSVESLNTLEDASEATVFHRDLDRHVSVPKFPPPPPPVDEFETDSLLIFDDDELALWEIEKSRMCVDETRTALPMTDDSIVLDEDEVDLNETFIDEATFNIDRPMSDMSDSVFHVYSRTSPHYYVIYLSKSVEV
ncbi:hypothetical protein GCK32_001013 [Trichostrongylus colubriformis]|uniref:Uncharacterized protein n=1 Tax=Trichostrongylus colubriformis TaxID=6319 RepID=A0AAN8IUB1_TRICO